jgi:hypothetical protein
MRSRPLMRFIQMGANRGFPDVILWPISSSCRGKFHTLFRMAADNWTPIRPDELRVGHYIKINHRWFDHPFVRKVFRLTSEDEIAIIRNAGLTRLFVDHAQSHEPGQEPVVIAAAAPAVVEHPRMRAKHRAAQLRSDKVVHNSRMQAQRESLALVHMRYQASVERAHALLAMLKALDPESGAAIGEFVGGTVGLLAGGSAPLALVATTAPLNAEQRVALLGIDALALAATIGKRMGLPDAELRSLATAAALHGVNAQVLSDCGGFPDDVVRIVREHRERPDGSGYPARLSGEAIHPLALVLGAIREFQEQCSPGRATPAQALAWMYRNMRAVYGEEIINQLIASMTVYPPGTYVLLSDGSIGRVLRINEGNRLRPVVGLFEETTDLADAEILDLSQTQEISIQRFVDVTLLPRRLVEQAKNTWAGVALAPTGDEHAA